MKHSRWDKRVQRAADLAGRFPHAAEVLAFYQEILEFQRSLCDEIFTPPRSQDEKPASLRERLDISIAAQQLPRLLSLIDTNGPEKLAQEARELRATTSQQQRELLASFLLATEPIPRSFFPRVLFQPWAEFLSSSYAAPAPGSAGSICPFCGARPQAAVLRPEGDGGKRFLLCSLCLTEWEFRRILCPICDEKDHQKLPRYTAEDIEAVRVEACDTCHYYLKSVDLTIDGLAVPLVDEVATVSLDLWASEHGYKKAEANLMGF